MIEPIRGMSMAMAVRPCGRLVLGCRVASVAAWEALAGDGALRFRLEAVRRPDRTVFVGVFEGEDGKSRKRREIGRSAQLLDHAGMAVGVRPGGDAGPGRRSGHGMGERDGTRRCRGRRGRQDKPACGARAYVATMDCDDEQLLDAIHTELEAAAGAVERGTV